MISDSSVTEVPRRLRPVFLTTLCFALMCIRGTVCAQRTDRFRELRERMVSEAVEAEGITNEAVLNALRVVPRHEFVSRRLLARAYQDMALPIGNQQTISPPYIVAYMTETLDPQPTDKVLEIGTGSGYQAAVLGEICSEVYSIEIVPELGKSAERRLRELGYENVHVRVGDGYLGWPEHAPFDRIIVTCSPESVPQPLIDQLTEGGVMIIPVGERYQQSFYLMQKVDGEIVEKQLVPTLFVPMTGQSEDMRRVQPNGDRPVIVNNTFEVDKNGDERLDGWHYQRNASICTDQPFRGSACVRFENQEPGEPAQMLQGQAVNGYNVAALRGAVWTRLDSIRPGARPYERAGLVFHFYDAKRRELSTVQKGNWRGSLNWSETKFTIPVPPDAREMIVRVGLNGATGVLDVDELQFVVIPR